MLKIDNTARPTNVYNRDMFYVYKCYESALLNIDYEMLIFQFNEICMKIFSELIFKATKFTLSF